MSKSRIQNRPDQLHKRRNLRRASTAAETALWQLLRNGQLHGKKFRRQHGIENFIVDFYCSTEHLVIELDDDVHNDPLRSEYDMSRQQRLEELGFKVLRFQNKAILDSTEAVLGIIFAAFSGNG